MAHLKLGKVPLPDMACLQKDPTTWMEMYFDAFDDNPPTIEEVEYLLVNFTDLIKSNENVENAVNELDLNNHGIYDAHAFSTLALYLSAANFSSNHILCMQSWCFANCFRCLYLRPTTLFCFDNLSISPVCCLCLSTYPTVMVKLLVIIVDVDLQVFYEDVKATILIFIKENVSVALKFGLSREGLITSTNLIIPQSTSFSIGVNEQCITANSFDAANGKRHQDQQQFLEVPSAFNLYCCGVNALIIINSL